MLRTSLVCVSVRVKNAEKQERKEKEEREKYTHTVNCQDANSRLSANCQLRAAKETKYKIRLTSECYVTITQPTV